jgi:hypothetical protein
LLLGQSLALTNGRAGQSSVVGLSFGFYLRRRQWPLPRHQLTHTGTASAGLSGTR